MTFKNLKEGDKNALIQEFSEEDIRTAVWDCDNDKSLGPNGVNFKFVKEFWNELKADFFRVMTEFHQNGKIVKGANSSFMVLIPKKTNPMKISDFRPISLIGCIYKVLSKVLANKIKKVIGSVISETQSAFISGR